MSLFGLDYFLLTEGSVMVPCCETYRGAHKSLARATSQFILFDGENISFDASLVRERGGIVVKALRY